MNRRFRVRRGSTSWFAPGCPRLPRAVVTICHGVNSHGGQYAWVGERLASSGLAAYALDLRGRGKSDGERFYVEDVADYVTDLAATIALAKSRDPRAQPHRPHLPVLKLKNED